MSDLELPQGWLKAKLSDVIQSHGEKVSPMGCDHMQFLGMDHVEAQTTKIIGSVLASSMKSSAARFYSGDVLYGRLTARISGRPLPISNSTSCNTSAPW